MVIGQDVPLVQRLSRYCLELGAEVFPYYGTPTSEEVALFNPEASIFCIPDPQEAWNEIDHPYILWSEACRVTDQPYVSTLQDLERHLKKILVVRNLA
ncbi:MAG TPA: hypothetical protein V6D10_09105 [Trichocoleus sp.]